MPLRFGAITENSQDSGLLAYLLKDGLDSAEAVLVDDTGNYIHVSKFMRDVTSNERIGKFVFTLHRDEAKKALEIIDVDITLDSAEPVELRFLEKLADSSESNEYYDVEATAEGQHLQIETVNRHSIKGEITDTTRMVRTSAFPFRLTVYEDMEALNKALGFHERKIGDTDMTVGGLSDTFAAPGSLAGGDYDGEVFSFLVGVVKAVREVSVSFGERTLSFAVIQLNSALGLLPVAAGHEVFDLNGLAPGSAIAMYADIKADFAVDQ